MPRPVTLIAALLTALTAFAAAGCAADGKSTSARRTVEVPKFDVDKPGLLDPAFAPDRLRGVDVCATLQAVDLGRFGTPAPALTPDGFGTCSNFMKDRNGKPFNVTLYFDEGVSDPGANRIGGLPGTLYDNGSGSCFASAAYTGADTKNLDEPRGLEIQLASEQADACSPAVQILADAVDVVRTKPPVSPRASGGLGGFDPCEILDQAAIRDAAMGASADSAGGEGLYACKWMADNSVAVTVSFEVGALESSPLPPADLAGVPGIVVPTSADPPTCAVEWEHRKNANAKGESEIVQIQIMNMGRIPMDPCANATKLAQQARAKLPTA
ncbi:DUF3558 family protein [Saccharopolyspora shandongensis]|uniref:DUF3558 family protein n=1 Tax=Saccharopolyspora shandongensis TaxID=418495 RepID=UPI003405F9D3